MPARRRCAVSLLALSLSGPVLAQRAALPTPIAPVRVAVPPGEATGEWKGVAGLSLAATSGNTSTRALLLNVDVAHTTDTTRTSLVAHINEGKNQVDGTSRTTAGRWDAYAQHNTDISTHLFAFGKLGFERDRMTQLALRTQLAAGVGRHLLRTEAHTVDVFAGVSHTDDRYEVDKTIAGETGARFRSTGLLFGEETTHQLTENTFFKQRLEYYPGVTGERPHLTRFNGSLSVSMSRSLALTVGLTHTRNSRVAAGQQNSDISLFTGVSLKIGP